MSIADSSTTTARVRRQYETFPYPHRDPAGQAHDHTRETGLDDLEAVNHYCYRGRRDFRRGFRVLVAGGGTGDATVFLARQLADTDARIVHLDLSDAAIDIARRRTCRSGLEKNVSWMRGSLLDVATLGLGTFDYINCCGVLHHLDDPSAGLAALKSVLDEDGAIGLMLYGRYGRTGVYHIQDLMRLLHRDESDIRTMVDNTKEVLAMLPPTNWLKRAGSVMPRDDQMNDAEFLDMFLHAKDRPFSVPELYGLLDHGGLNLVEFTLVYRAFYDLDVLFQSPRLGFLKERLSPRQRRAVAEIIWGLISKHTFWVSRHTDTVVDARDPDNVPKFTSRARMFGTQDSLVNANDGPWSSDVKIASMGLTMTVQLEMSNPIRVFARLIDGQRTMGRIVQAMLADCPELGSEEAWDICCSVLRQLQRFDFVFLRHASVPSLVG